MPINSIASTTKYAEQLDKMFVQKSVTGFLTDNAFGAKFVGTKQVSLPDVSFVGLADYDRDNGFSRAKMTVARKVYTLTKDRARSIMVDAQDMDETGVAGLAGQVLGEYVRTNVVPECDSYILSTIYGVASSKSHTTSYNSSTDAITQLLGEINKVQANRGFDEDLVAFVDPTFYNHLMTSAYGKGIIEIKDFKQGDVNLKVKSLNGVAIIPVAADRMRTAYTFSAGTKTDSSSITTTVAGAAVAQGETAVTATSSVTANDPTAGGFTPTGTADYIRAIVMPKNGASVVKKTEKLRVWTPDQNIDADAYKFDYRIFYDAFIKKSNENDIYALYTAH